MAGAGDRFGNEPIIGGLALGGAVPAEIVIAIVEPDHAFTAGLVVTEGRDSGGSSGHGVDLVSVLRTSRMLYTVHELLNHFPAAASVGSSLNTEDWPLNTLVAAGGRAAYVSGITRPGRISWSWSSPRERHPRNGPFTDPARPVRRKGAL